jgi:hypothetical protein
MPKPLPDPARRRLLARTRDTAAAAAALAALPAVPAVAQAEPAPQAGPDAKATRGYHETERMRRYYQLARY